MTSDRQSEGPSRPLPLVWERVVKYGIAVIAAVFYVSAALHFDYTPDASYVTFRVASRLVSGDGFTFNPGQPSAGTGGPVWTLLIAAGVWGGLDAPIVGKTFDLVFACLALFAVYFLAALILRDKIAALLSALLFSVDAWVLRSGASGLGHSLALLMCVVTLWYGYRREYTLASLVNGLAVLCAPLEGIALFLFMMVDAAAFWRRTQASPKAALRCLAAALASVLPWVAFAALHAIPLWGNGTGSTFSTSPFSGQRPEGEMAWYAASGGVLLAMLLLGHGAAIVRSDWRLIAPSSFPMLWAFGALALRLSLGPEGMAKTWVLVAPVVVIYGLLGLYYLSAFAIGLGRKSVLGLLAVVVASLLANQAVYRLKVVPEMNRTVIEMQEQVRPMAHWLRSRIGPEETLVAPFVGMIGWISDLRVVGGRALWAPDGGASGLPPDPQAASSWHSGLVVDRSADGETLTGPGLVPVRSWRGGAGALYTLYADSARRELMLGPRPPTGAR